MNLIVRGNELKPFLAQGVLTYLNVIGDAQAPHLIAQAVYSGHLAAREFDELPADGVPFRREMIQGSSLLG